MAATEYFGETAVQPRYHVPVNTMPKSHNHTLSILGDPGAVSRAGRKGATKVFKHRRKSPWVPSLTGLFPNGQESAGSWLGTKNALYYFAQSANSISRVLFVSSYTTAFIYATFARFVHQAFLTRNEGTTDESKNVSDAISRSNLICTEKILFLTDHNVS